VASPRGANKALGGGLSLSPETIHSYRKVMDMKWWLGLSRDLGLLAVESAEVMARRSLKLARADRRAWDELQLMVSEKAEATVQLQLGLLTGRFGRDPAVATRGALDHVRRKVRANRQRLRR
jgi:hypothetical protein